jgi:hypothetical protein
MSTVRASRVDYYHQHDVDSWQDQLGSIGMTGQDAVFLNRARTHARARTVEPR